MPSTILVGSRMHRSHKPHASCAIPVRSPAFQRPLCCGAAGNRIGAKNELTCGNTGFDDAKACETTCTNARGVDGVNGSHHEVVVPGVRTT